MNDHSGATTAGPLRRLGAMFYDSLLVIAILIVATVPFVILAKDKVLVPSEVGALAYVYWIWQLTWVVSYFVYFWRGRGRTLGMQAWYLHIERDDHRAVSSRDALTRLAWAAIPWVPAFTMMTVAEHTAVRSMLMPVGVGLLGLGLLNYLCAYWTADRRAWHERRLTTRIVLRKR